ncbi:MAG: hypothetical protein ABIK09_18520 [Pseudomonadota bacterium]
MKRTLMLVLVLLVSCGGGDDGGPAGPDTTPDVVGEDVATPEDTVEPEDGEPSDTLEEIGPDSLDVVDDSIAWPECPPLEAVSLRSLDEGVADGALPLGEVFEADPGAAVTLPASAEGESFLLILYDLGTEMAKTHTYDVEAGRGAAPGGLPPHPQAWPTPPHPEVGEIETLQVGGNFLVNVEAEVVLVNDVLVVYRDTTTEHPLEEPGMDHIQALADDFQALILPRERFLFGHESDVDGDGRFGMLISYQVNLTGAYAFVTHCDLVDSSVCGYGNHREMIYVAIPDPESMIKTPEAFAELIAHELNHSIYFHRKFQLNDSVDWTENVYISEGLSGLAQDLVGFNRGNLFVALSGLGDVDLVSLPDIHRYDPGVHYFGDRDGPLRGASYLFNRYLFDRTGGELMDAAGALEPACGVKTLRGWFDAYLTGADLFEALTGLSYDDLAADFFTALALSNRPGLEGVVAPAFTYLPVTTDPVTGNQRGVDLWGMILGMVPMNGPMVKDVTDADGVLREGGVEYLRVDAAGPGGITVTFDTGDAPAPRLRVVRIQ